jgi:hypothetical protein
MILLFKIPDIHTSAYLSFSSLQLFAQFELYVKFVIAICASIPTATPNYFLITIQWHMTNLNISGQPIVGVDVAYNIAVWSVADGNIKVAKFCIRSASLLIVCEKVNGCSLEL